MNNDNSSSFNNISYEEKNEKKEKRVVTKFTRKKEYKKSIFLKLNKHEINKNDLKAEKLLDEIMSENNITLNELINIPISDKYPFDGYLFSYIMQKQNKTEKDLYFLIHYLKFYDTFNELLIKIYNNEEKIFLFHQIINKIVIEEKEKNDILYKVGDISEKFYFLLNGNAIRLKIEKYEANMNKFEFFLYMKYLYKLDENKLFNLILKENEEIFDKYELLYFILEDKTIKYARNSLKQLKNMEETYITKRIIPNKMLEYNYDNEKKIVLFETNKTLNDIFKGDYVLPNFEGHIKKINIDIKDYLDNLKPINFKDDNDELIKNKVNLYTYNIDKKINVGEHLEELDLKKMQKRDFTIICSCDCIFGSIFKKDYISCLKVTQTKFHKNDINFLLRNELFSMMNFREFDKNYYHLFEFKKLRQNQILFEKGEITNKMFFLKKGEICVTFEGSFNDIYRIISLKGGPKNRKILDINYIKRFHSINLEEKIFKEKQMFTLFKIKENFPIGFDDFLDEENEKKNLFKAYCIIDSEVLVISRENLNEIIYKEIEVRKVEKNYVIKRNKILINELNLLKNGLIQNYINEKYDAKLELPYLFDESPLLLKSKMRIKNILSKPKKVKNTLLKIDTKLNDKLFIEIHNEMISKINKEKIEMQKYKFLNPEKNKSFKILINTFNISNTSSNNKNNIHNYRRGSNSFKVKNIKELSKKAKINNDILELIKTQNSKELENSRNKKTQISLDPYEKIYKSLKNDDKYKVTDFSYLGILFPPHPNKQISKSKKNIFNNKLKIITFNNILLSKFNKERRINFTEEAKKNLVSSINIVNNKKKIDENIDDEIKIILDDFQLNKFHKVKYNLSKIFDNINIKNAMDEASKKENIFEEPIKFPKIIK